MSEHEPIPYEELQSMVVELWGNMRDLEGRVACLERQVATMQKAGAQQLRLPLEVQA
jgi:hypothetical protein